MPIAEPKAVASSERMERGRVRLDYLDGLRGLSALGVVFFHATDTTGLPAPIRALMSWTKYGAFSVAIFIVLSGYCLMLPVVRSADGTLRGGVWAFIKRRARRILPPYYAAVAFSLLVIAGLQWARLDRDPWLREALPAFSPGVLFSHLAVVHNLSYAWVYKINGPFWSVATEWQIYFVFPALLLPLWRRLGAAATVVIATVLGLAPHFLLPSGAAFDWVRPWYLGLFAMGMAGAVIGFSADLRIVRLRERAPWGLLAVVFPAILFGMAAVRSAWWKDNFWPKELLIGLFALSLIVHCTRGSNAPKQPWIYRLFDARPVVRLGEFSYSLYLVHVPAAWALGPLFASLHLAPLPAFLARTFVMIPAMVGCAYLFHLAFERRFMPGHLAAKPQPAPAALAADPAIA